ncbi:uncharacterized protein KY384_005515 [Bacidia gigantensis]|uniref:uncharacterized protein n=1 Tax=Bacidia gigantensis TaxID=2732470 RepID=UPI001D040C57|nr:uncharacterized protein KY384_005515 [Bacidia gigantensis]KAG8530033.1 hypothetical protein KY384_005515 [Bacidia gigantensis]
MADTHNIVILGASYGGIGVANGISKAITSLKSQTEKTYKITLIANSTHFWYSVGAPRAMLKPYPKSNDDSFFPISKFVEQQPAGQVEFIHAEITDLDTSSREVYYKTKDANEDISATASSLHFDTLVIALGSKGASPLYSLQGSHVTTLKAYEDIQSRLPSAKSVIVVGGGSAGVETAGELGDLHGSNSSSPKDITIFSGSSRLLTGLRPAIGTRAEEMLNAQGVKAVHDDLKLQSSKRLPDGREEAVFSDGSTRTVDILIVATGRSPASSFLPKSLLDASGKVKTDDFTRIPGVDSAYALGDIASISPGGLVAMMTMVGTTYGNVIAELSGKGKGKGWKPLTTKEMQLVPVGPNGGVGAAFGWWLPSFAVKMIKSKTFMFDRAEKWALGQAT